MDDLYLDSGLFQQVSGEIVRVVAGHDYAPDAGVYDHLGAKRTGEMSAVNGGIFDTDSKGRGLHDGVLLCMNAAAELVAFAGRNVALFSHATHFGAVLEARRGAVVTGREYPLVLDDYRSDAPPQACRD